MAYAIARIKKLKRSNLAGSEAHTARQRETPNADPDKHNIRFIGTNNPTETLDQLVMDTIGKQKRKIRPDAVYCTEILLTASPEYFRPDCPTRAGYYEQDKVDSWMEASKKWLESQYGDCIVRAELHLDEATPHIHAYFVPLDEFGQLRAKHFFDGRQKMRQFQDSYSAATEHLGLERGLRGSRAQHQDIKDFYSIVNQGIEPDNSLTQAQLQAKAADRDRAIAKKQQMEATAKALAIENELKDQRIKQLEAEVASWRQQTLQLRDLPLEDVAWELGLHNDQGAWKGYGHIINIDGSKFADLRFNEFKNEPAFMDNSQASGFIRGEGSVHKDAAKAGSFLKGENCDLDPGSPLGGNSAIDLVMHVNNCNLRQAVVWLHERFGESGAKRAAIAQAQKVAAEIIQLEPRPKFKPPVEDKALWQTVSNYLTQKRGIPQNFVEVLHNRGLVYADSRANAVFVMRNLDGQPKGAFLRGTRGENNTFKGYEKGTIRSDSWFHFHLGGQPTDPVEKVVLCKSPIDAISRAMLEFQVRGDMPPIRTLYLAVDNPNSLPVERLQHIPKVQIAFESASEGDCAARVVKKLLPQAKRQLCKASDWNQQLRDYGQQLKQQYKKEEDLSL
ncbi:MobV family relaxase [Fischerella sp. PCC 9605]|uniref:MobV family relaxase n=1 Tax=Fischerella sp. PCC 9605 TaxID=1173024 RepID=UPI00047B7535|nr:MobV family relaxase [Fischerella sp. PCC 9605]